jgi:hypothetical protein
MSRDEPAWWKYVGGRDEDRQWAAAYVAAVREGRDLTDYDRHFYLSAIERLAADAYEIATNRPPARVNFWLACHYWLAVADESPKAAALLTVEVAQKAGISRDHKAIQRKSNELETEVGEFLDLVVRNLQARSVDVPAVDLQSALRKWVEARVQKVG